MKKHKEVGAFLSIISILSTLPAQAVTLGFSPFHQTTNVGNTVSVDLVVSDLEDDTSPSLGEFDLVVEFDSRVLSFEDVDFGDVLNPTVTLFTFRGDTFISPEAVNLFEISGLTSAELIANQPSNFTLATFTFDAIGVGTSDLLLSNVLLGDPAGVELPTTIESGSIEVLGNAPTTVPESSPLTALFFFGMGSFCCFSRRLNS